jgi:hypothetical protein
MSSRTLSRMAERVSQESVGREMMKTPLGAVMKNGRTKIIHTACCYFPTVFPTGHLFFKKQKSDAIAARFVITQPIYMPPCEHLVMQYLRRKCV